MPHSKFNSDIEALRAVAVAITVFAHIGVAVPQWTPIAGYFWLGGGVDLFFAISGYLIVKQLLALRTNTNSLKSFSVAFWTRRLFRLWPAALSWSLIAIAVLAAIRLPDISWSEVLYSWTAGAMQVENLYLSFCVPQSPPCQGTMVWHYWSLSLEEQFYCVSPLVIFFIRKDKVLILGAILLGLIQSFSIRPWGSILWFIRSDAILYGCATALMWHGARDFMAALFRQVSMTSLRVIGMCSVLGTVLLSRTEWTGPYFMGYVAISAAITVAAFSANSKLIPDGLTLKVLMFLGSRSYSIYLIHFPVFFIIGFLHMGSRQSLIIALSVTALLADFSYRQIEAPLRDFGRSLATGLASGLVLREN